MRNFKQLKIWQKGFAISVKAFKLVTTLSKEEKFVIGLQLTKSAVSIPSNIAEGSSRLSEKDYCRFVEIALGSAFELETQLLIAKAANFGSRDLEEELLLEVDEEEKMLIGFMNQLKK